MDFLSKYFGFILPTDKSELFKFRTSSAWLSQTTEKSSGPKRKRKKETQSDNNGFNKFLNSFKIMDNFEQAQLNFISNLIKAQTFEKKECIERHGEFATKTFFLRFIEGYLGKTDFYPH